VTDVVVLVYVNDWFCANGITLPFASTGMLPLAAVAGTVLGST
jgi:hypothetical protein